MAAVPVARRGPGRAELPEKVGAEAVVGQKEVIPDEKKEAIVEMPGVHGEGRYGLRPEELDSEGRYVGELHGDGRQGGFELEGTEVR